MRQVARLLHGSYDFVWSSERNQEKEQASLRVALGAIVVIVYGVFAWLNPSRQATVAALLLVSYVIFGALTWLVVDRMARPSRARLIVTTILDQAFIGALLAVGPIALPMLWAIFWFLIGAGCRYGKPTLALSCAAVGAEMMLNDVLVEAIRFHRLAGGEQFKTIGGHEPHQ
jgi:hypothetical protein